MPVVALDLVHCFRVFLEMSATNAATVAIDDHSAFVLITLSVWRIIVVAVGYLQNIQNACRTLCVIDHVAVAFVSSPVL